MADLDKTIIKNLVSINRNSTNREIDEVTCDGRKIATTAVEYLLDMGHNDIGYVGECHGESRYKGYVDTLMRHDLELNPSYIFETKQTEMAGYEIMEKILKAEDIPTAIYCANDITAIGMLKAKAAWMQNTAAGIIPFSHDRYIIIVPHRI